MDYKTIANDGIVEEEIKKYNDEMIKLLDKAKKIINAKL